MFKQARFKLTLGYTAFFVLVISLFSIAFHYSQVRTIIGSRVLPLSMVRHIRQLELADPGQRVILEERFAEQFQEVTNQLRIQLLKNILVFDFFAIMVCLAVSYWLAGYTLLPLEKSYQLQQQFLQDASHELRTPLSVMQGEVDLTLKKKASSVQRQALHSIREEVGKMTQLVNDILFLARNGSVNHEQSWRLTDLNQLAKKTVAKFRTQANQKKIELLVINQDHSLKLKVKTDPDELSRALSILLDNALKYTPARGQVKCGLATKSRSALMTVEDNGPGISQQDLAHIFDRFYRGEKSRTSPGSGLGLAIAQQIVNKLGGQLLVKSKLGAGSSFVIQLPLN